MKSNVHPQYHHDAQVTCSCGNKFTTGSTLPEIQIELCSQCHPFYTGEMRFVDTQGRVEKFEAKRQKALKTIAKKTKKTSPSADTNSDIDQPKTLKEMMSQVREQSIKPSPSTTSNKSPSEPQKKPS